jgi:hypothetical protein
MKLHPSIVEHWHGQYQDLQLSTSEFYSTLSAALERQQLPKVTSKPVYLYEGGLLSRKREYFVIERGNLQFLVCAAPYGRSFFFSWYMREYSGLAEFLGQVPLIGGWLYRPFSSKPTLYRYDTLMLFKESVKRLVLEVLEDIDFTLFSKIRWASLSSDLPADSYLGKKFNNFKKR